MLGVENLVRKQMKMDKFELPEDWILNVREKKVVLDALHRAQRVKDALQRIVQLSVEEDAVRRLRVFLFCLLFLLTRWRFQLMLVLGGRTVSGTAALRQMRRAAHSALSAVPNRSSFFCPRFLFPIVLLVSVFRWKMKPSEQYPRTHNTTAVSAFPVQGVCAHAHDGADGCGQTGIGHEVPR